MALIAAFRDRVDAGRILAREMTGRAGRDALVLGLPRGGVVVAREVAAALGAELDILVVRKVGYPGRPELAVGAVASGAVQILDKETIDAHRIPAAEIESELERQMAELRRREELYRRGRPAVGLAGREVILVDDGIATGFSMRAAVQAARSRSPARLLAAAPVGEPEACRGLEAEVDAVVCPLRPSPFYAVGVWYDHFAPVDDERVGEALADASLRK